MTHELRVEGLARFTAELINGGDFYDPRYYNDEQRALWRGHAEKLLAYESRRRSMEVAEHLAEAKARASMID